MEILIGFVIAIAIAMTGVGAGTVTAPTLILFLGMPLPMAVGTALIFGAVVKSIAAPVYWVRKQVDWRTLWFLLAGGLPGVILSSLVLSRFGIGNGQGFLLTLLGLTIIVTAGRTFFSKSIRQGIPPKDRTRWLPLVAAPIGAEVGFSSAGAGALGTSALMLMTPLTVTQVVGTDLFFGLALSLVGGGAHLAMGDFSSTVVLKLIAGGIAGAIVGATLATRVPARIFRYALSSWLVYLGFELCHKGWHSIAVEYASFFKF
jgi:uncharacterized membrane protein YfcA